MTEQELDAEDQRICDEFGDHQYEATNATFTGNYYLALVCEAKAMVKLIERLQLYHPELFKGK